MKRTFISTPYKLVEYLIQENLHIKYANFIFLKTIYANSCIYKYSIKNLSDKAKKSRTFIKQNVEFFLLNDWCRIHNRNLVFNSNKHIAQTYKLENKHNEVIDKNNCIIDIETHETIKLSLTQLIIINKKSQVDFIIKLKQDRIKPSKLSDLKKAKRYFAGATVTINENFILSYDKLAEMFSCSRAQAFRIIQKLVTAKYINKKRNIIPVMYNVTKEAFKALCMKSAFFLSENNCVYESEANTYQLIRIGKLPTYL